MRSNNVKLWGKVKVMSGNQVEKIPSSPLRRPYHFISFHDQLDIKLISQSTGYLSPTFSPSGPQCTRNDPICGGLCEA